MARIISVVEEAQAERWGRFRDRYGDWGRDLALYFGRKGYGIKLRELVEADGGMDYISVSVAGKRLQHRAEKDAVLARCRTELKM